MPLNIQVVSGNIPAGLNDVTFEYTDFGEPQLAIFQWGRAEAFDTPTANGRLGFGACTSDDQFATNNWCIDGGGNLIAQHYHTTSHCYVMHSTVLQATAYFKEWSANGVTITFDLNNVGAYPMKITCILINGLSNVKLKTFQLGAQDVEVDVTGFGFEPTDIIGQCVDAAALDTIENNFFFLHGFAHNGDTLTQCSMNRYHPYSTYSYANMLIRSTRIADRITNGAHTWELEVANFDSDGFSLYARDGDTSGVYYSVIALQCPGDSWCGVIAGATSNGNKSYTGVGFQPIAGFLGCTAATAFDSQQSGYTAESVGISAFTENNAYSHVATIRDNSTNAYSDGVADELAWDAWVLAGVYQSTVEATFVSFDADGFTLNFTTNGSTQYAIAFLIGSGEASIPYNITDTLEASVDAITYELLRARSVTITDTLQAIADTLDPPPGIATALSVNIADEIGLIEDAFTRAFLHGFVVNISDELQIIQDTIKAAVINLETPKRWLAPLKITPAVSSISPLYLAAHPIRHPDFYFMPKVKNYGVFRRSTTAPAEFVRSGDVDITIDDSDNAIRRVISYKTIKKAEAELRLGPEGGSYGAFLRPYRRSVVQVSQNNDGDLTLKLRDKTFEFLERKIPNVVNSDNFPNLAENTADVFAPLIIGNVSSSEGALPLTLVDKDQGWYLICRHVAESVSLLRKNTETNEWEAIPGGEYSLKTNYYVDHELGSGDYCTIAVFGADQQGAEMRANVTGYGTSGSSDTTYTNFANAILAMLQYLTWATGSSDIINMASFEETRARVADLQCAGAWVRQLTFGEALTQLQRSSNIHIFADKNDRITAKYTADDEEPTINLSDLLRLYKGTVRQTMAEPSYNRIPYKYSPNYADGTWVNKNYDNAYDQEVQGEQVESEELALFFVRDADTAQTVVERRAQFLDLDSFRFEAEIPLVPVLEEIEVADLVSIDHFGGLKAGGYVSEQFLVTDLEMNIKELKYTVKGIRRRLPPPSSVETYPDDTGDGGEIGGGTTDDDGNVIQVRQGIDTGRAAINARVGPFYNGVEGELFAIFRDSTNQNMLFAWYTQNWGVTWVRRDVSNAPTLPNNIVSFDCFAVDGEIHVATGEASTGRVAYHVFDMSSKTWSTINDEILSSVSANSGQCVSIERRDTGGEPVVFFQGAAELLGGTYWRRGYYSILQSGAWSAATLVTPTPKSYLGKASSNCDIQRVVRGREDRMHFFYEIDPAERWVSWSPDDWARTMQSGLNFGSAQILNMSSVSYPPPRNMSSPVLYSSGSKIAYIRKVGYGRPYVEIYAEGSPLTLVKRGYISGQIMGEGGSTTHNPAGIVGVDGSTIYALDACWSDPKYIAEQESTDEGATWSSRLRAGPNHASRYSMETLIGAIIKVRSSSYIGYFCSEPTFFPVFRWLKIDDLPYS